MDLREALDSLDPSVDAHWTKKGEPDLNALKELTGAKVSRKDVKELDPDFCRPEQNPPLKETGGAVDPMEGIDPIAMMDMVVEKANPEWLRMNGEFAQVLIAYKVQRPAIMARRDRMKVRAASGARQAAVA